MSETSDGLNRLAFQFKGSDKLTETFTAFLQEFDNLLAVDSSLESETTLENAIGIQLDLIGEIVGVARPKESIDTVGAFGFLTDDTSRGFTDLLNLDLGGGFVSLDDSSVLVSDDIYRIVIKAKIIQNKTTMTVDDTTNLLSFMFGGVEVRYFLYESLKPIYAIGKIISPLESFLLSNVPTLIGIDSNIRYISYDEEVFSFADDISGLGFGSITDPDVGGNFAKIII